MDPGARGSSSRGLRGMRGALAVITVLAPLVPVARRRVWIDQWRAELWHYAQWLHRDGADVPVAQTAGARVRRRAPRHQLRLPDWSPRMILHDLKFAWRMFVRRPGVHGASRC